MSFRLTGRSSASKNLLANTRAKICEEEDDGEGTEGAKDYVLSLEEQEIQRLGGIEPRTTELFSWLYTALHPVCVCKCVCVV